MGPIALLLVAVPGSGIGPISWRDTTSTDGVSSTLEHSQGKVMVEDVDGDGVKEHLHFFPEGNPRILKMGPAGVFSNIAPMQLPEEMGRGTTWSSYAALVEDFDSDGRADLLIMPYSSTHPVRIYLSTGAVAPRLWRAGTEDDVRRIFSGLHDGGRFWHEDSNVPANMKNGGDAVLADLDGDGVREIVLVQAGARASVYARPYIDATCSGATRLVQTEVSAEAHYPGRLRRNYVYPGQMNVGVPLDFAVGTQVLIAGGANRPLRATVNSTSQEAGYPYEVTLGLTLPQGVALQVGGSYRVYRADQYQEKFFEFEEHSEGNVVLWAARAARGEVVVADLDHDGRQEVVVVDFAKAPVPMIDDKGHYRSATAAQPYPGNPRIHVFGFNAAAGKFVDWANMPGRHAAVPGIEVPQLAMAGRSLLVHDMNGDGVDDIIVGQGPRFYGENVCYTVMIRGIEATADTRWGCPEYAPEGRIESSNDVLSGTPGIRILPEPPIDYRDRLVLVNLSAEGGLGFVRQPEAIPGFTENYGSIAKMFKVSDRAGDRVVVIRDVHSAAHQGLEVYDTLNANGGGLRPACAGQGGRLPAVISDAALDDVNRDGILDIAFSAAAQDFIFYGDAAGCFAPSAVTTPLEATWVNRMAAADFNKDGLMDFVGAMNADSQMDVIAGLRPRLLLGAAGKRLIDASDRLPNGAAKNVFAGDLNGDGNPDIFLSGRNMTPTLLLGDGSGRFRDRSAACLPPVMRACNPGTSVQGQVDCQTFVTQATDINGDGRTDLILGGYRNPNRILFGFNSRGSSCAGGRVTDHDPSNPKTCSESQRLKNATAGAREKCMPYRFVDAESELNAIGQAGKILPVDTVGQNRTFQLAVGDFNGDRFGDVAVGSLGKTAGQTKTATVFENVLWSRTKAEAGTFLVKYGEAWTQWFARRDQALLQGDATPDLVSCLATGDITGDGIDDLLLVRSGSPLGARDPEPRGDELDKDEGSEATFVVDPDGQLVYPVRSQAVIYAGNSVAGIVPPAVRPPLLLNQMRSRLLEDSDARFPGTRAFACAVVKLDQDIYKDVIITGYGFGSPSYRMDAHLAPYSSQGWSHTYSMNASAMTQVYRSFGLDPADAAGRTLNLGADVFPREMMKVYSLGVGDLDGDRVSEIILGTASQVRVFSR
jgi:hypothetical protein